MWGMPTFLNVTLPINFIHIQGALFLAEIIFLLVMGRFKPLKQPFVFINKSRVDLTPWKYATPVSICLVSTMIFTFTLFSKIGLAIEDGIVSIWFWPFTLVLVIATLIASLIAVQSWKRKYLSK